MALGKRSSKRPLQEVLGQGANINPANPLEVHDPKVGSLISYEGTTTADGAGDGSSLEDSVLTTKPDFDGNLVIITSGDYAGQARDITGATTGGTVTPSSAFSGQILRGTTLVIVALRLTPAEVAAIEAKLDLSASEATFTYLDAGGEQTVFSFTPAVNIIVQTIWLDLTNLTQNNDIRIKIGGVITETFNWTTGMDDGLYFRQIALPAGKALLVTMQETVDEAADRVIPYYYAYEERE